MKLLPYPLLLFVLLLAIPPSAALAQAPVDGTVAGPLPYLVEVEDLGGNAMQGFSVSRVKVTDANDTTHLFCRVRLDQVGRWADLSMEQTQFLIDELVKLDKLANTRPRLQTTYFNTIPDKLLYSLHFNGTAWSFQMSVDDPVVQGGVDLPARQLAGLAEKLWNALPERSR